MIPTTVEQYIDTKGGGGNCFNYVFFTIRGKQQLHQSEANTSQVNNPKTLFNSRHPNTNVLRDDHNQHIGPGQALYSESDRRPLAGTVTNACFATKTKLHVTARKVALLMPCFTKLYYVIIHYVIT